MQGSQCEKLFLISRQVQLKLQMQWEMHSDSNLKLARVTSERTAQLARGDITDSLHIAKGKNFTTTQLVNAW